MNKKLKLKYVVGDYCSSLLAWAALFVFRKISIEQSTFTDFNQVFCDRNFWWGIVLVPFGWLCLYYLQGSYDDVGRKSRLKELQQTFTASLIGVIVIFFALLLDDNIGSYHYYYVSFTFLFIVHFLVTYIVRLLRTSHIARQVHGRKFGFKTLIVGNGGRAASIVKELDAQETPSGNLIEGYLEVPETSTHEFLRKALPCKGSLSQLQEIVQNEHFEEVVVALESSQKDLIVDIWRAMVPFDNVMVKTTPDMHDIVCGSVKINSIFHSPLILINPTYSEPWQPHVKRLCDIVLSMLALVLLSPLYLFTAIMVKLSSPGPVFYAQTRVGLNGTPFKMHKFRSMYVDAEKAGPALSSDNDPRITRWGRFMRKVRLDEIPQFYNVLKGTMSIVGPRPERQYFIDKIVERAPEYMLLLKIKPGITSWGQVKFGYAENVDEMVQRLKYDLLYIENMSLTTDLKILIYTVLIVVQGRGK